MISLAESMAKSQPPVIEYRMQRFGKLNSSHVMAGIRSLAKAIPKVREAAREDIDQISIDTINKLPEKAIAALTKKALEVEEKAAARFSEMEEIDRFKVMRITDELRANMCTILQSIADLSGGNLPAPIRAKWTQFNCAA